MGRRWRDSLLGALVLAHLAYSWMFSDISVPNERTRTYLTVAIVDQGTLRVDGPLQRFGTVFDLASFDGHYFTDKAPGSSFLAVPIYAVARLFSAENDWTIVELVNLVRTWLMLPIGLLGFFLLRRLLRNRKVTEPTVDIVSLGYVLGSSAFHYATAFYGHTLVATFLLGALVCFDRAGLFDGNDVPSTRARFWVLGAGALAGLIGLTEYQAVVAAALLILPVWMGPHGQRARNTLWFGLGAAPLAFALLWYNQRAFGGPFELSYHHLVGSTLQGLHGMGLAGATRPTWEAFTGLLFSAHRGLITTSPLMGIGLIALAACARRVPRSLWLFSVLTAAYFVLIVSSSSVWYGGWSFGPRLLVPITGLCALAAGIGIDAFHGNTIAQGLLRACIAFGVLYQQTVHAFFAEPPPEATYPLHDIVAPMLDARVVSPNLACKLLPLGPENLIPLALLVALVVSIVAFRSNAPRAPRLTAGFVCIVLGFGSFALLASTGSSTPEQALGWAQLTRVWASKETTCGSP